MNDRSKRTKRLILLNLTKLSRFHQTNKPKHGESIYPNTLYIYARFINSSPIENNFTFYETQIKV